MSKALVIKGANFYANKIEQIDVSEPIPCTGITLSQSTLSFTQIGATETLTATLTPVDTTDSITWASSDEDVATVSNGVVTCVGIGVATITAFCGTQTAECAVTATVTINMLNTYTRDITRRYSGSVNLANNKDWIGLVEATNGWTFYSSEDTLGGYRAFLSTAYDGRYLMPIPNGTKVITAVYPAIFNFSSIIAANSNQKSKASGADGRCAAAVAMEWASTIDGDTRTMSLNISNVDANGFILGLRTSKDTDDTSAVTGDVIVTFS